VPVGLQFIYTDGFTGGYPVGDAGLRVLRRNDDNITQRAHTLSQCFKTGGIDTIVIGYHKLQNVFSDLLVDW
jgi:hypothetical protein